MASKIYFLKNLLIDFAVCSLIFKLRQKNRLALVRLDAIGDFVLWLDTAKEYSKIYPDKKITLIANSAWAELANELPYWESVWPIDIGRLSRSSVYRWQTLCKTRKAGFEIAIQPTFSRVFLHGDSIICASGATQRVGSVGDLSNISRLSKAISDRWYTMLVPASKAPLMELERNAEFITHLSGKSYKIELPCLNHLKSLPPHLQRNKDYFIIFPGASWHGRRWPEFYFSKVLADLHQRYGWEPVVCGSKTERALCQSVADMAQVATFNLAGETSLAELAQLTRGAKILIGNETSAIHIAAAVGTPAVCILGGGHYGRFMPYPDKVAGIKPLEALHPMDCFNCNWRCNQPHSVGGPVPCVAGVTVERVLACCDLALRNLEK